MNIHNIKDVANSLLLTSIGRFNTIKAQLEHIKNIEDKNNIPACLDIANDFIEIAIKYEKESFNMFLKSIEGTISKKRICPISIY